MLKFSQETNKDIYTKLVKVLQKSFPGVNPLFYSIYANTLLYEFNGKTLEDIASYYQVGGDYPTKYGITSGYLQDIKQQLDKRNQARPARGAHYNLRKLSPEDYQRMSKLPSTTAEISSFSQAAQAAYYGTWKKLALDSIADKYPKLARVMFDAGFNASDSRAARFLTRAVNGAFKQVVTQNLPNIKAALKAKSIPPVNALDYVLKLLSHDNVIPPKNSIQLIGNKITIVPLPESSTIMPNGSTLNMLNWLIQSGLYNEDRIVALFLKERGNFHKTKSPKKFLPGLLNRVRSQYKLIGQEDPKWRKKNPGFHSYIS